MEIMEKGTDSVNKILTHMRDHPDEPCLIHCTGTYARSIHSCEDWLSNMTVCDSREGSDWNDCCHHPDGTSVLCVSPGFAVLTISRKLLGVADEEIVKDYTLTTIGLEPALPALIERFKAHDVYRNDWEGTINMSSSKWVHRIVVFRN